MSVTTAPARISRVGHRRLLRAEVHALGDVGEGVVECYASVFDVEFMEGSSFFQRKVRIEKGAFEESLQSHDSFPVMWEHDWDAGPIGHSLEDKEDDHGLWGRIQLYTDSDRGRNIWRSMEAGAIFDWSIGFYPLVEEVQKRKKNDDDDDSEQETIVIYKKVDLAERSVVVRGANPDTETISVQSAIAAGLRVARGGVLQEVTIDGVRYGSEILGGGLAVQELSVDGTRYWAVPVCQDDSEERSEEAVSWVPGAERLLERDSFRKIFRANR